MKSRRRTIPLQPHEDALLRAVYTEFGIPSDQYAKRPMDLFRFIRQWNALSEREDADGEVLHYIKTKRKNKRYNWVTFDGTHKQMAEWPDGTLTDEQWDTLRAVYEDLFAPDVIGSDNLAYDVDLARACERAFAERTGRILSGQTLFALIMSKRKRGEWARVRKPGGSGPATGFGDIDEVAV